MSVIYGIEGKVGPSALGYFFNWLPRAMPWAEITSRLWRLVSVHYQSFMVARARIASVGGILGPMNWLLQRFKGLQFPKTERQARYGIERSLFVGFLLFVGSILVLRAAVLMTAR